MNAPARTESSVLPQAATNTSASRIGQAVNLVRPFLRAETAYIWLIETVMIGWGHQFSFESARMDKGPVDIGDDHH